VSDAADNGADGETGCWLSATPGGKVKFNLFFDIFLESVSQFPTEECLRIWMPDGWGNIVVVNDNKRVLQLNHSTKRHMFF
jgi:hypothetical protein